MSTSLEPQPTTEERIRAKFTQFRILVIGRANAGKTTILRRLCNSTGDPTIIFSPRGKKIESSTLNPSIKRGEHAIENEMIFEGNPGFIFHDSRGFEAGAEEEFELVREFIDKRSKAGNVKKQLHAIWYCIPTSDDRPITAAENKFFNKCGTGIVPVIVLWTKTDSLEPDKVMELMDEGLTLSEAWQQAPEKAWADYEKKIHQRFARFKYPPKAHVAFRKMHEDGANCSDLIEKTTAALSSDKLQRLFLSTQQNRIEVCVKYGVKRIVNSKESVLSSIFKRYKGGWTNFLILVFAYFPQLYITEWWQMDAFVDAEWFDQLDAEWFGSIPASDHHNRDSLGDNMSHILSGLSTNFNLKEATYLAIVAAIVAHLSFFLHEGSPNETNSLERAVEIYNQSSCDTSIKQAVERIFQNENLFESPKSHFFPLTRHPRANSVLLAEEAVQAAMDNLILI